MVSPKDVTQLNRVEMALNFYDRNENARSAPLAISLNVEQSFQEAPTEPIVPTRFFPETGGS
jgi:hypothetical protein